jgi:2-dehydropantoate 2-reductase
VVGAGAVGGYYGARLAHAGHDVHFLFHAAYGHVVSHGLVVDSKDGDFSLPVVQAYADTRAMPPCDAIIVALKTTRNHVLASLLPPLLEHTGTVLLFQNGYNEEPGVAAIAGVETVIAGLCFICSSVIGPGHIRHLDYGRVRFARYCPGGGPAEITALMNDIGGDFLGAGIPVDLSEDLLEARWKKLIWNVPFSGMAVVYDTDTRELVSNPVTRRRARALMEDLAAGAASCGRQIGEEFIDRMLADTDAMAPYRPSMKLDFDAGRELETESLFAGPLKAAGRNGVSMPAVESLYREIVGLVAARDAGRGRRPPVGPSP